MTRNLRGETICLADGNSTGRVDGAAILRVRVKQRWPWLRRRFRHFPYPYGHDDQRIRLPASVDFSLHERRIIGC